MLKVVQAVGYLLLQRLPVHKAYRVLVMQQLHLHVALCILVEYHLQVSRHGQNLVHVVIMLASELNAHQRKQTVQV